MQERMNRSQNLEAIVAPLLNWYHAVARILPWREEPTPYRVLVSEIMLQQTRVEAVLPFFERFMQELPDFRALAAVPEDRLLKLWQGLGYYNRARNLKRAAQQVVEQYGGQLPRDFASLLALPGIGPYTAGAVASIAYGLPVPAVDGNVLRVMARICAVWEKIDSPQGKKIITDYIEQILPQDAPGDFNQALMELGATVCLPNGAPLCSRCPVGFACAALRQHCQQELPRKTEKKQRRKECKTVFVIRFQDQFALRKRPDKGLLAGLWEFPWAGGHLDAGQAADWLNREGISLLQMGCLSGGKHIFTHVEWEMTGYWVEAQAVERAVCDWLFVSRKELEEEYALPSAYALFAPYQQEMPFE